MGSIQPLFIVAVGGTLACHGIQKPRCLGTIRFWCHTIPISGSVPRALLVSLKCSSPGLPQCTIVHSTPIPGDTLMQLPLECPFLHAIFPGCTSSIVCSSVLPAAHGRSHCSPLLFCNVAEACCRRNASVIEAHTLHLHSYRKSVPACDVCLVQNRLPSATETNEGSMGAPLASSYNSTVISEF
jgi:hypothetical protein